ncbi:polysaccharide biosynthesis C-terminal domain-containing protein [Shewanella sp. AS16]|uniref:polysaccharide biosynthesis C-terminal domain-containing protein n=1 Tax=Shewanella sp. AS16 TaxID=2907625 RepID=UPI001F3EFF8E|nr:polysaccharide biosynthesis C-terminal domain-containing protein [Shewanella sp. AS16]MCE9686980.1 polysaccharide biosynthesis C-terminal domain-containing protein [Shewanella sp. AS16]
MDIERIKVATFFELVSKLGIFCISFVVAKLFTPSDFGVWNLSQSYFFFIIIAVEYSCHQNGVRIIVAAKQKGESIADAWKLSVWFRFVGLTLSLFLITFLKVINVIDFLLFISFIIYSIAMFINSDYLYRSVGIPLLASLQNIFIIALVFLLVLTGGWFSENIEELILFRSFILLVLCTSFFVYSRRNIFDFNLFNVFCLDSCTIRKFKSNFKVFTYVFLGALFARAVSILNIFILDGKLNKESLGLYSAVSLFYLGFITLKGVIMTQLYPYLCFKYESHSYFDFVKRITCLVIVFCLLAYPPLFYFGNEILKVSFGESYLNPDTILAYKILILTCMLMSATLFFPNFLHVSGNAKRFFILMVITVCLNVLLNIYLIDKLGIVGAAMTTLMCEILVILYSIYFFFRSFNHEVLYSR